MLENDTKLRIKTLLKMIKVKKSFKYNTTAFKTISKCCKHEILFTLTNEWQNSSDTFTY